MYEEMIVIMGLFYRFGGITGMIDDCYRWYDLNSVCKSEMMELMEVSNLIKHYAATQRRTINERTKPQGGTTIVENL